jgi:ectoine hydroxylase-related dioxygenase (phytanoyl-CoA dioxygenase family)
MFAVRKSPELRSMATDPLLISILEALLGSKPLLFQSINFLKGSEQEIHSDSIHMTTYPLGKLIAVWIALEDVDDSNGPLVYYPKSHLLPYYLNADYNNEGNRWMIGSKDYEAYEAMARRKIAESGLNSHTFHAKKGDILIWHANLFHGGAPHTDATRSRKSMVLHYFGNDAICYHEITQRPALMDQPLSSSPI